MGIEPTQDPLEPHTGFEDQERHQAPPTSISATSLHHNTTKCFRLESPSWLAGLFQKKLGGRADFVVTLS